MNGGTLRLLVHMYCFTSDVPFLFNGSPQHVEECRDYLYKYDLIDRRDEMAELTERGRVHVEALLAAPLPERIWVSPLTPS